MGYIKDNLTTGEEIIKEYKLSKWVVVEIVVLFLIIIGIPSGIKLLINYLTTEQALTNKRTITKTGLISRDVQEMRLNKIETVEYKQSLIGIIMGYVNVKITGTLTSFWFYSIDNPKSVKRDVDEAIG
jgi:uncharacterized membrane protein YdbT with pleckstrin-like domain